MAYGCEKRRCRRFEIPGAEGKYKKTGLLVSIKGFSAPCEVIDVSKGGLSFICNKKLSKGKKLVVQLIAPNETPLDLNSVVLRQKQVMGGEEKFTGVRFMPFGDQYGMNPQGSLKVLRKLDKRYGNY